MEKPNYYLVIHTDAYTGNFERECIAYSFGKLQESQENYAPLFQKAFWNKIAGEHINSYKQYLEYIKNEKKENDPISKILEDIAGLPDDGNEELKRINEDSRRLSKMFKVKDKISNLYDEYLKEIYQEVDDWEEDTFYNIDRYYDALDGECNCIYVQLDKPLNKEYEELILNRIKDFFAYDIYAKVKDYEWICTFGHPSTSSDKHINLVGLELVDSDKNLVKKYM